MRKNKKRDPHRHKKWEQSRADKAKKPENDTPKISSDFQSALGFGMTNCQKAFSDATNIRVGRLRKLLHGRDKPTPTQKTTVIRVAKTQGWTPPDHSSSVS